MLFYKSNTTPKKVRGLKKKCLAMIQEITKLIDRFPTEYHEQLYWNYRPSIAATLLHSSKTPRSVRRLYMQTMIDRAYFLTKNRPKEFSHARVCFIFRLPELFFSEVTIFFSEDYFQSLVEDKNGPWVKTFPISHKDITKEYNLNIPENFQVKGYKEELFDNENCSILEHTYENWYIGELA